MTWLLAAAVLAPLLAGVAAPWSRRAAGPLAVAAPLPALVCSLAVGDGALEVPWLLLGPLRRA